MKILENIKEALSKNKKNKHKKLPFKVIVKKPECIDDKDLVIYRYIANEPAFSLISKIMKKGKSKFICTEFGIIKKYVSPDGSDEVYCTSFKKSNQLRYVCKLSRIKKIDDESMLERILIITNSDYDGFEKIVEDFESPKSIYTRAEKITYTKSYINFENKIEISFSNNNNKKCVVDFKISSKYKDSVIEKKIKSILNILDKIYEIQIPTDNCIKIMNTNC